MVAGADKGLLVFGSKNPQGGCIVQAGWMACRVFRDHSQPHLPLMRVTRWHPLPRLLAGKKQKGQRADSREGLVSFSPWHDCVPEPLAAWELQWGVFPAGPIVTLNKPCILLGRKEAGGGETGGSGQG